MRKFKNRRRFRLTGVAAGILSLGLVAAACGGGGTESGGGGGNSAGAGGGNKSEPITIGYIQWNEDIANTFLWKYLLEQRGYKVETKQVKAGLIFKGMARGDIDLFMDTWLPKTHKNYWETYGDKLTKVTKYYDNAPLALAVPKWTYKKVDSIPGLGKHADLFDGKITGIGGGAGETDYIKHDLLPAYGLKDKIHYQISSTNAMLTALDKAVENHDDIVVALWYPHWAWNEYPIKPLKDPKGAWGEPDNLFITARGENSGTGAFKDDYPKVYKWISKYHMTHEQEGNLSNAIVNGPSTKQERQEAAKKWVDNHQDLVNKWVPPKSG